MYYPAVYYINTEWHVKYCNKITKFIQKIIEQLQIYMISQSSSVHCEALAECWQRNQGCTEIFKKESTEIFKKERPVILFEVGLLKEGHFPCCSCEIRIFYFAGFSKCLTSGHMQSMILSFRISNENALKMQTTPCYNLL